MPRPLYPLEGDRFAEIRFNLYDKVGKEIWGELRIRRQYEAMGSPDLLVQEIRQRLGKDRWTDWKPILHLAVHDAVLLAATFGIQGGENSGRSSSRASVQAADSILGEGRENKPGDNPGVRSAEVRENKSDSKSS